MGDKIVTLEGMDLSAITAEQWDNIDLDSYCLTTGQLGFVTAISSNSRRTEHYMRLIGCPSGAAAEKVASQWHLPYYKKMATNKRSIEREAEEQKLKDKKAEWQEVRLKAMGSQFMIERAQEKWSRCPDEFETDKTLFNFAMDYQTDIMEMPDDFCGEEMADDDLLLLTYMDALLPKEFLYNNTFDCHENFYDDELQKEFKNISSTSPETVKENIAIFLTKKVTKDVARDLSTACKSNAKGDPKFFSSIAMNFGYDSYREGLIQSVYLTCKRQGVPLTPKKKVVEGVEEDNSDYECTSFSRVPFSLNNLEQAAKFCAFIHLMSARDMNDVRAFISADGCLKFDTHLSTCISPLALGLQKLSVTSGCDVNWRGGDSLLWFNLYLLARIVKWTGGVIPSALLDAILSPTIAKIKRQTNLYMHYFTTYTYLFL